MVLTTWSKMVLLSSEVYKVFTLELFCPSDVVVSTSIQNSLLSWKIILPCQEKGKNCLIELTNTSIIIRSTWYQDTNRARLTNTQNFNFFLQTYSPKPNIQPNYSSFRDDFFQILGKRTANFRLPSTELIIDLMNSSETICYQPSLITEIYFFSFLYAFFLNYVCY